MQITVYRVEDVKGHGPFQSGVIYEFVDSEYHRRETGFPAPIDDIPSYRNMMYGWGEYVCACRTTRQLLRWFPAKVIRRLRQRGYRIAAYRAEWGECLFGDAQIMFNPLHAERLWRK